mmetsp:Transcript_29933/g.70402  ORF Transcript_29933/g.70402 Transcript_29933/m.70402 type:complete len:207 (-) Transcript_29933:645-1265(-)
MVLHRRHDMLHHTTTSNRPSASMAALAVCTDSRPRLPAMLPAFLVEAGQSSCKRLNEINPCVLNPMERSDARAEHRSPRTRYSSLSVSCCCAVSHTELTAARTASRAFCASEMAVSGTWVTGAVVSLSLSLRASAISATLLIGSCVGCCTGCAPPTTAGAGASLGGAGSPEWRGACCRASRCARDCTSSPSCISSPGAERVVSPVL